MSNRNTLRVTIDVDVDVDEYRTGRVLIQIGGYWASHDPWSGDIVWGPEFPEILMLPLSEALEGCPEDLQEIASQGMREELEEKRHRLAQIQDEAARLQRDIAIIEPRLRTQETP